MSEWLKRGSLQALNDGDSCCRTDDRSGRQKRELKWGEGTQAAWEAEHLQKHTVLTSPSTAKSHNRAEAALPRAAHACSVRTQEERRRRFSASHCFLCEMSLSKQAERYAEKQIIVRRLIEDDWRVCSWSFDVSILSTLDI